MENPLGRSRGKRLASVFAALALSSVSAVSGGTAPASQPPFPGLPPGEILFRVNGSPIGKAEFQRFIEIAFPEETEPPAARLRALADSFINHRLLAAKARAEGIDRLPAVRSRIETRRNRLWTTVLWNDVVEPSLRIEENDLAEMAPAMEDAVSLQQLTVESREQAEELRRRALAGEDFGEIVKAHSVGLSAHNGGLVGFVGKGSPLYGPELIEELFRMRPGEYSAVAKTDIGYAVIRVLEKKPASQMRREWLERNRDRLVRILRRSAWEEWKEKLARSHVHVLHQEVVDAYLEAREQNASLEPHLMKVAVTVDGVPFTLRDLIDPSGMGVVHAEEPVHAILRKRVAEFALAREAEKLGLREKHPDILLTETLLGEYLLAREYVEFRSRDLTVTEKERREYYDTNRKKFVAPRAFRLSLIETRSPARLKTIYGLLEKGTPFEEVADRWSDNRDARGGDLGYIEEGRIPPSLAPATKLAAGEYARNPIRLGPEDGGESVWIVPKLRAVREKRPLSFEETDRSSVAKSVMAQKRERLLREILTGLRRDNRIEFTREFMEYAARREDSRRARGDDR